MKNNEGMYQNYNVEGSAEIKVTPDNNGYDNTMCMSQMNPLVYECPEERCVNKQIIHEVNHIKLLIIIYIDIHIHLVILVLKKMKCVMLMHVDLCLCKKALINRVLFFNKKYCVIIV